MAGINGVAIALTGAGSVLVYAGLRHVSPLVALREIASGRSPGPVSTGGSPATKAIVAGYTGSANAAEHAAELSGGAADVGTRLAKAAMAYVGHRYVTGGTGPDVFDCSGLVWRSFRDIGVAGCPRTSGGQFLWRQLAPISQFDSPDPVAGDLAFWPGHVVILTGQATFVGAQNPRRGVITGALKDAGPPGAAMLGIRRYHL